MSSAWGPQIRKGQSTGTQPADDTEVVVATVDAAGSSELTSWVKIDGLLVVSTTDADATGLTINVYRGAIADAFNIGGEQYTFPADLVNNQVYPYRAYDALDPLAASTFYTIGVVFNDASGASIIDAGQLDSTLF